jgi:hypothetical protein
MEYTFAEFRDMHFVYGLADGNAREAERLYRYKVQRRCIASNER